MGLSVSPDASLQRSLSDQQLGKVGVVHSVLVRPPETCQPHQVFQVFPGDQPLLLKLPAAWRPGVTITAFYEASARALSGAENIRTLRPFDPRDRLGST
eukprot:g18280.t1